MSEKLLQVHRANGDLPNAGGTPPFDVRAPLRAAGTVSGMSDGPEDTAMPSGSTGSQPGNGTIESVCMYCGGYISHDGTGSWRDLAGGSLCTRVPVREVEHHHRPIT
jgi:hypothetical protein